MGARIIYWNSMATWKYELGCIEELYRNRIRDYRLIKIFLAVMSSLAIGSLTVDNRFATVWGMLLAAEKIVSAVGNNMPYRDKIHDLGHMADELGNLYCEIESGWWRVDMGELSEDEIYNARMNYARRWENIKSRYLSGDYENISKRIANKICEETNLYFANIYGGSHE